MCVFHFIGHEKQAPFYSKFDLRTLYDICDMILIFKLNTFRMSSLIHRYKAHQIKNIIKTVTIQLLSISLYKFDLPDERIWNLKRKKI